MYENEVLPAFEILLEEIETIIDELNQDGARSFSLSKHQEARTLLDKAEAVNLLRSKLKELQNEWLSLETQIAKKSPEELKQNHRNKNQRLQRGLRTPEDEYRYPILESLAQLGGNASSTDVLNLVEEKMRGIFNEHDLQPLISTPSTPRWRNTAQWARNSLVNDKLLEKNSPKGIWEISEAGRRSLHRTPQTQSNKGDWEMEGDIPKVLYDVLSVYRYVVRDKYDYNEAVSKITEEQGLRSIHTIYDACTRRLNLNTEQFRKLLDNPQQLSDYLSTMFPENRQHIIEVFDGK